MKTEARVCHICGGLEPDGMSNAPGGRVAYWHWHCREAYRKPTCEFCGGPDPETSRLDTRLIRHHFHAGCVDYVRSDFPQPHVVRCGPLHQLAIESDGSLRLWVDGQAYHNCGGRHIVPLSIVGAIRWLEEAFGIGSKIGPWAEKQPTDES